MITDAVVGAITAAISFLIDLLPNLPELPSWFSLAAGDTVGGRAHDVGLYLGYLAEWVNLGPLLGLLPIIVTLLGSIILVRIFRWVFSAFTGGGGGGVSS